MARPKTALIIDDEAHVRMYMRMLLLRQGLTEVHEASDGVQAIELYATLRPDVVLLDVVMPGLAGSSVLKELQAINPDIPVIVVTSQSSYKVVQEFHEMGAVAYLLKHAPYEQMVKMLSEALDLAGDTARDVEDTSEDESPRPSTGA